MKEKVYIETSIVSETTSGAAGGLTMFRDPIVEEVREARQRHAVQFDYDLRRIAKDLQKKQRASGRRVVSYPAKPVVTHTTV